MTNWPHDTYAAKVAFYGDFTQPHWQELNLARFMPPFQMHYGKVILTRGFLIHHLIGDALYAAFQDIWTKCGKNQAAVDQTGASDFGGCFNIRKIAGSDDYSNHSWACAIDLSPSTNGFNMQPTLPHLVIDAFKAQGARWGGDYHGRKDPMHFEFVAPA